MSAIQSYLSASKYGYDMVVGTTQASINATMKQFLSKFDGQEFVRIYVYKEDVPEGQSHYVETDFEAYKATLGFDPFDVPDGTSMDDEKIKKLKENLYAFGFKAKMGLPTNFPLKSLADIIVLDKGNSSVSYNLYCKEFQITNLNPGGYGGGSWENLNQNTEPAPWTFGFTVDLDLYSNDSAFSHLPEEIQNEVKNLCPGSMFSVQQLYLDLNTAGLESTPTIKNLDTSTDAYIYLTKIFLNKYFKNMQESSKSDTNPDGNYLLGYSIKPSQEGSSSSIIPTDLNFMVSPYLDEHGNATQDFDMYTLNWLVMTEGHRMPSPVQFEWNWVDKVNVSNYHGAMSIKKSTFTNFLNKLLSPSLKSACWVPSCNVHTNFVSVKYGWSLSPESNNQTYNVVNDNSSRVLTFSYSKTSHDSDTFVPNWGNMDLNYSLQTDVYLEGTKIRTVSTATCYVHMNADGGIAEGNVAKYTTTVEYDLGVDAHGDLKVTQGKYDRQDQSDDVKPDVWGTIVTAGTFTNVTDAIKSFAKGWLVNFLSGFDKQILSMLNGSGMWVFPGGDTFVFKNAQFSNFQDLVSDVTYADPSVKFAAKKKRQALERAALATQN